MNEKNDGEGFLSEVFGSWIEKYVGMIKVGAIIAGVVAALAIVGAIWNWQTESYQSAAWNDYMTATRQGGAQVVTELKKVSTDYPGHDTSVWARLVQANIKVSDAADRVRDGDLQEKDLKKRAEVVDEVAQEFNDAIASYQQVIDSRNALAALRARFGKAAAYEYLMAIQIPDPEAEDFKSAYEKYETSYAENKKKAMAEYQSILGEVAQGSAEALLAQRRVELLVKYADKPFDPVEDNAADKTSFVSWLAQNPIARPPKVTGPGAGRMPGGLPPGMTLPPQLQQLMNQGGGGGGPQGMIPGGAGGAPAPGGN